MSKYDYLPASVADLKYGEQVCAMYSSSFSALQKDEGFPYELVPLMERERCVDAGAILNILHENVKGSFTNNFTLYVVGETPHGVLASYQENGGVQSLCLLSDKE